MSRGERIRVLRVIARMNVGGPALHVSYLTRGLESRGYETTLVAGTVGAGEGSMDYVPRELGIEPVIVPELQREIATRSDRAAVRRILTLVRERRPHVLHTHTAKAGAIGRAAALLAGDARPDVLVHTYHGHVLSGYFDARTTAVFRQVERALARSTDALVAVSPQVRDDLVRLGVAPATRFSVIRLGLDLERRTAAEPGDRDAARRRLGLGGDRFVVGWLGRMTAIKRVEDVVAAAAAARRSGAPVELVLVGDGPLRPALETLAAQAGVADACRFVGFQEDVGPLYAAFDAVVLASANEGTPVSLIEALAAGRPVVSTAVGGVADVVRDGENGLLVPAGDTGAVADALVRLAEDPDLRERLGRRGRELVLRRYAVPRLVDDVDRLYRSLLDAKRPRSRWTSTARPLEPALDVSSRPPRRADRRLRVLLLSQYFPPEVGATQTRIQSFAEYLAARGHDVTVISEFPNHPHGVIPPAYAGKLVDDDRSNPYRVLRVWVQAAEEKTQLSRMQFYLSYLGMALAAAPRAGRPDVVVATSPPLFAGLAGLLIARGWGAPFVLDVRDLWPAAAISLDQLSNPAARRLASELERALYREAAAVVAVTRPFCRHVDAIRGRPPRTAFVPNGTLPQFLRASPDGARAALGVDESRYLVTFAGNLGIAQALGSVLRAAALTDGDADFAFVGDGPAKEQLVADAAALGLRNVHFHPQVALDDVPPLLAASDALLVTLSAHPTFQDFVPSKMVDYMAVGRPVVVSAAGEAARVLERCGAGIAVPPEHPQALADAVLHLKRHPEESRAMGERGRRFARGRLRETQAARLEAILLDVARGRAG